MSRDQRVKDNFALAYAQKLAIASSQPLLVLFNIDETFPSFNKRNAYFMFKNLEQVEQDLASLNISMIIKKGEVSNAILDVISEFVVSTIITDFSPLKSTKKWLKTIAEVITIPLIVVDTHNIVPCWIASPKQEYSARTIRPKINKLLDIYFIAPPEINKHPIDNNSTIQSRNWQKIYEGLNIDSSVKEVKWLQPGELEAQNVLQKFIALNLGKYNDQKNDPTKSVLSNLSAYLHFGQISAQRIAWEVMKATAISTPIKEVFLEELIIRKELADNFCYYNEKYDQVEGFHSWAQESLSKHLIDKRDFNYSLEELEEGKTHDELWNAAQHEMVTIGKMHGYMRMYWAKKILEWTETPAEAQRIAITLNDKYELDGRDPNGYTGIAWSIGGIHDRPWGPERPIFGLVRYMNFAGAKRKFNVQKYIDQVNVLSMKN